MKVIEIDGQYLIQATGTEMTVLEDALYQRALQLEGHATDWRSRQHPEWVGKMLAAVRHPYRAQRDEVSTPGMPSSVASPSPR